MVGMALTMKIGNQGIVTAAATASCAVVLAFQAIVGPAVLSLSPAAAQSLRGEAVDRRDAALFTVPDFNLPVSLVAEMQAVPVLVQPWQLASVTTRPGQKFNWRRGPQFSKRELLDLSLKALRRGQTAVPPVYLSRFPVKLAKLRSAKQRKDIFIKTVLPLVIRANDEVRAERHRLLSLIRREKDQGSLSPNERAYLNNLAADYEVPEGDLEELQRRVDVVPASLALAQGAEESGWGTSRFARLGNAVFGQRTFRKGGGLVPLKREQGKRHEVKAFNSLYTSVRAYVWNLNTHFAYDAFRKERAAYRSGGRPLNGYVLTGTLKRYSERGQKYIETIRVIMRANRLGDFDDAQLLSANSALKGGNQPS